jgi:hypothetical protein
VRQKLVADAQGRPARKVYYCMVPSDYKAASSVVRASALESDTSHAPEAENGIAEMTL